MEWHENEEYWEVLAPLMFNEERMAAASDEVDAIVGLLELEPNSAVLDLACGIGRHSVELAKRGHRVTGVDSTKHYIKEAKARCKEESVNVEFIHQDMRRFQRGGTFHAALNMRTSFGHFPRGEDEQVIRNVANSLRPGGHFLMELAGPGILNEPPKGMKTYTMEGMDFWEEFKVDLEAKRIEHRFKIDLDGEQREFSDGYRIYSPKEMTEMMELAGLDVIGIYSDLGGTELMDNDRMMVVVAMKPE